VGFPKAGHHEVEGERVVEWHRGESGTIQDILGLLRQYAESDEHYDFALIDLRNALRDPQAADEFISDSSQTFFSLLRALLVAGRYCSVVVDMPADSDYRFPVPWAVALAARNHLRLRDEKIGLIEAKNRTFYSLYFQAVDDECRARQVVSSDLRFSQVGSPLPAWLMPRSPPRKPSEMRHPAKFPEPLIDEFVRAFTSEGDVVFDPMAGTGSALIAAANVGRKAVGLELNPSFVKLAYERIEERLPPMFFPRSELDSIIAIHQGDATQLGQIEELKDLRAHYCVTSPPYWSVLHNRGSEYQRARRRRELPTVYSADERDIGNIEDYSEFLQASSGIFHAVTQKLVDRGWLTVVVKNLKRKHVMYTLAWDLLLELCGPEGDYEYAGTTLWCQDDVRLKPFAVGTHWVSNILHHYCLHLRKRAIF